ncbi:hypothetical protein [Streptomyces sp. NPDC056255]|uniref:hypothetical protein n=1 Tax=Streptomyces sp. NPDC056255 TaxID=3345764 RepID=UPI0035DB0F8F
MTGQSAARGPLANARHGRYTLASTVRFAHRGVEWGDRIAADRAVAYRIHLDTGRGRQTPLILTDQTQNLLVLGREVLETVPDRHPARP